MSKHSPHPTTLLSQCRWALWLFLVLMAVTVGFFWQLSRELRITRITEAKTPAKAAK
jgi:cell division septal protein FtsQ